MSGSHLLTQQSQLIKKNKYFEFAINFISLLLSIIRKGQELNKCKLVFSCEATSTFNFLASYALPTKSQ